jgi:MoxR-like ATPase
VPPLDFTLCRKIMDNISRVVAGKERAVELVMVALLAEGHLLLEDVPGVGKTLLARSLAASIGGAFRRIQFTPDLLPSDVTGFNYYNQKTGEFKFQPGPVMSNILLADEINRTIPRTQSSLLESMQENQVTVDGVTMPLARPFFVMATQNPIEQEGTYPLPEAQLDRFLMRLDLGYPSREEELLILKRFQQDDPLQKLGAVAAPEEIVRLQEARRSILVSPEVSGYIVSLAKATRTAPQIRYGASPRASLHLMRSAQALAALHGRDYVLPDDVKFLSANVLAHRLVIETSAKIRGVTPENVLAELLDRVPVPAASIAK